jgi:hypothetical protein
VLTYEEGHGFIKFKLNYKFVTGLTEEDGLAVQIGNCIQEVSYSNLDWTTKKFSLASFMIFLSSSRQIPA